MSDPIPSASGDPGVDQPLPTNAEDRRAAAALSSLNANQLAADAAPAQGPSIAEQEALGKAMSRLEIAAGEGTGKHPIAQVGNEEAEAKKKAVKVAAADVSFVVSTEQQGIGYLERRSNGVYSGRSIGFAQVKSY